MMRKWRGRILWLSVPLVAFACGSSAGDNANGGGGGAGGSSTAGHGQAGSSAGRAAGGGAGENAAGASGSADTASGAQNEVAGASGAQNEAAGAGGVVSDAGAGGAVEPAPGSATLTVHVADAHRAISPLIYGVNPHGSIDCAKGAAKYGLCRLGGHAWSTYNWENNASNAAIDNCYQNDALLSASTTPGAAVTSVVAAAKAAGAATLVTIPILDYVAADESPGSPSPDCSGDVRKSANYLSTRFKMNRATKGAALSVTPDTTDAYVYQDEFVSSLAAQTNSAQVLFALDNQPDTWANDQPAAHPQKATYAEVVQRNVQFATMLRGVWPSAEITGYVGYGYYGFLTLQDASDAAANGVFVDYYLSQMKAASDTAGQRLIDYLDVHWYSEAIGDSQRVINDGNTPGLVAARVQAPRSLWDTTYVENSWITSSIGGPISLIPWLKQKIATDYPGTKLAISEWAFGGASDISGGLAAADTLGIFGVQGVDLAAYVSTSASDQFVAGAFDAFRNYDGAGSRFGDTSVSATTSSTASAPVYASVDSTDGDRLVVIALNRGGTALPTTLNVDHTAVYVSANVYQLTSASSKLVAAAPLSAAAANSFATILPPYSISVIVPTK